MTSDHFGSLNKWHIYTSVILHCSSHKHRSVVLYLFINTYHMCSSKLTQLQTYIEHVLSSIVPHHTAWTYIQRPFTQCLCMLPMHLILFITSGHARAVRTWIKNKSQLLIIKIFGGITINFKGYFYNARWYNYIAQILALGIVHY